MRKQRATKKVIDMMISEITIGKSREIESIKLNINDSLVDYLKTQGGVSIDTPPTFALGKIGIKTIDLKIAV